MATTKCLPSHSSFLKLRGAEVVEDETSVEDVEAEVDVEAMPNSIILYLSSRDHRRIIRRIKRLQQTVWLWSIANEIKGLPWYLEYVWSIVACILVVVTPHCQRTTSKRSCPSRSAPLCSRLTWAEPVFFTRLSSIIRETTGKGRLQSHFRQTFNEP